MDIEKFFNSMDHEWLMQRLEEHIDDRAFLRLVRRLLRNSILAADGTLRHNERGSPQGSPGQPDPRKRLSALPARQMVPRELLGSRRDGALRRRRGVRLFRRDHGEKFSGPRFPSA